MAHTESPQQRSFRRGIAAGPSRRCSREPLTVGTETELQAKATLPRCGADASGEDQVGGERGRAPGDGRAESPSPTIGAVRVEGRNDTGRPGELRFRLTGPRGESAEGVAPSDARLGILEDSAQAVDELREIPFDHVPRDFEIHSIMAMDQTVAQADHLPPRDLWVLGPRLISVTRFAASPMISRSRVSASSKTRCVSRSSRCFPRSSRGLRGHALASGEAGGSLQAAS